MNDIRQVELYKSRSYTACISEAFTTFAHNLKNIFLHVWPFGVAAGIAMSLYATSVTDIMTGGYSTARIVMNFIAVLLLIAAWTALGARAATLFNRRKTTWSMMRSARIALVVTVFQLAVGVLCGLLAYIILGRSQAPADAAAVTVTSVTVNAVYVIVNLLALPYEYVFAKYLIEPDAKLRHLLLKGYRTGLRHWGFIFTTTFLTALCLIICAVITSLPVVIIITARLVSVSGTAAFGDPAGLPAGFGVMQSGLFAAAAFIWAFIAVFTLFVDFFIYGSIETREKEKKEFLNNQQ